ncbi:MAG: adenylosuccinate lyase [Chlamydiales bacterium]
MNLHQTYESPLATRYAGKEICFLFSAEYKYVTWRKLWLALAKAQQSLGLDIQNNQIEELAKNLYEIDYKKAEEYEKIFRHDVMAHIHAYGDICPKAKGVIHWGATSCFVTDNGDLIQMFEGLKILRGKLVKVMRHLTAFATTHADLPCLSYTHFQPAQPTTVGKRACLWLQDLLLDLNALETLLSDFRFLGVKGATGTQASFLHLFNNNHEKVKKLDALVAKEMGFTKLFSISGQTYTRKQDMRIFNVLSGIAASAHKFATDMRLLAHLKELDEPFSIRQVGSSAMPHKRNPMRCERICGLARFLLSLAENPAYTAATQWLERSLDDSANRRLAIPEAFLTADAILNLLGSVSTNIPVYPKMIERHLEEELPFMATENILMEAVRRGKDRQQIHERLKELSQSASLAIKEKGEDPHLLKTIANDATIGLSEKEIHALANVKLFIGRAPDQVREFLRDEIEPTLKRYNEEEAVLPEVEV